MVDHATGARDDDVAAAADRRLLDPDVDATKRRAHRDVGPRSVDAEVLGDLDAEFAGRDEDHRLEPGPVVEHLLQDREAEGRGLPGAGLTAGNEVVSGEDERDGVRLDIGRRVVAGFLDSIQDGLAQPEGCKCHFRRVVLFNQLQRRCGAAEPNLSFGAAGMAGRLRFGLVCISGCAPLVSRRALSS